MKLVVRVDNRLRFSTEGVPGWVLERLKDQFTHVNPQHAKLRAMGRWAGNAPKFLVTWQQDHGEFSLPRGGTQRLRALCVEADIRLSWDVQVSDGHVARFPPHNVTLLPFQEEAVTTLIAKQNCLIRSPTGAGKTCIAIGALPRIGRTAIVMVWTGAQLKQWVDRVCSELGMAEKDIGVVGGGKFLIRPLTIAMQQTVYTMIKKQDPRLKVLLGYFGVFIGDECVAGDTPVLMRDGTSKPIRDVLVGDEVMCGGRVTHTMIRQYRGDLYEIGGGTFTGNHPIGVTSGWVNASMVGGLGVSCYVVPNELPNLREVDEIPQPSGDLQRTPQRRTSLRPTSRVMPGLWGNCTGVVTGLPCQQFMRDHQALESGEVRLYRPADRQVYGGDDRNPAPRGREENRGIVEGPNTSGPVDTIQFSSANQTIQQSIRARTISLTRITDDCRRQDNTIRRPSTWERRYPYCRRTSISPQTSEIRVSHTSDCADPATTTPTKSLQSRSGTSWGDDSDRNRWEQPQLPESACCGSTQDLSPTVARVVGDSLQGAYRLQLRRIPVCHVDSAAIIPVHNLTTSGGVYIAGGVLVHNCQRWGADSFVESIDPFPCKWRIGMSADPSRADKKEFLIHDMFGAIAVDVDQNQLVEQGVILDVLVRVVPTEFRAPWYHEAQLEDGSPNPHYLNNTLLTGEMVTDEARNVIAINTIAEAAQAGSVLVFCHRVEHCQRLDADCVARHIQSGLMLGGTKWSAVFDTTKRGLMGRKLKVGLGTFEAIGQAIDIPAVSRGVVVTPVNNNRQRFGQVRGRMCRANRGGNADAEVYCLWDQHVFGLKPLRNLACWNKRVVVLWGGQWVEVREFIKARMKEAREHATTPHYSNVGS